MRLVRAGPRSILLGLLWAGIAVALPAAAFIGYCALTLPLSGGLAVEPTPGTISLTAANGQVFATRGVAKGERVAIDQLPRNLVHAIIAIEDRRFYEHRGIDIRGILRAGWHNLHSEGPPEG